MKFTLSWLKDHLETDLPLGDIIHIMGQLGLEIEEINNRAEDLAAFTTAKVISAVKHPDADKLKVCEVDTVDGRKQIVCGAPNARAGMTAIYAPLGSYIPDLDFSLDAKPRKIRGVESRGMLCSTKELNAGEDHDGIADLDADFVVGTPAAIALGLDDPIIDFEVTPNRPDWLGVRGIARDLASAKAGKYKPKQWAKHPQNGPSCPVMIKTSAPEACAMFAGVAITGVSAVPSPPWMQKRLEDVGITPRNILVDVTNYVSIDAARPLHAYDLETLQGDIVARLSKTGEVFKALDGKSYTLTAGRCVIADESGVIGLGGIMGGADTAVSDQTNAVLLEAAWFDPDLIARTGRDLGIISDARYRFERGVDPHSCVDGLLQAITILREVFPDASISEISIAGDIPQNAHPSTVAFNPKDVTRLTGLTPKKSEIIQILKALGFTVDDAEPVWRLGVPSWRFDISQSADLVEEIARVIGFDALVETPLAPLSNQRQKRITPAEEQDRKLRRIMTAAGYNEAISWSFMHSALAQTLGPMREELYVKNAVTPEMDYMRPSAIPNLAAALQNAHDRGDRGGFLFELGPIYLDDTPSGQHRSLTALVRPDPTRSWRAEPGFDSYDARSACLQALAEIGYPDNKFMIMAPNSMLWHPGLAASLRQGPKRIIGHFGAIHPLLLKRMGVIGPLFGFEIDLDMLPPLKSTAKTRAPWKRAKFSPIYRDFAFLVPHTVEAGSVRKAIEGVDKDLIQHVTPFDVYSGKGIETGQKSLAFEVCLRSDTTMTDEDIQRISDKIIANVNKKTGGVLR